MNIHTSMGSHFVVQKIEIYTLDIFVFILLPPLVKCAHILWIKMLPWQKLFYFYVQLKMYVFATTFHHLSNLNGWYTICTFQIELQNIKVNIYNRKKVLWSLPWHMNHNPLMWHPHPHPNVKVACCRITQI